jgi:hypothetical protein
MPRGSARGADWKARSGKGLLPGNPKQWENEHHALDLREELQVGLEGPFPVEGAFALLSGVTVIPHGSVPCAQCVIESMRSKHKACWSAFALPLDGETWVVFNDSHSRPRVRATLMEEFFHLRLGHPPSKIRVYDGVGSERTFAQAIESEAYGSGAAALVPYKTLRDSIERGWKAGRIARELEVSVDLVHFRAKVTRQYRRLKG